MPSTHSFSHKIIATALALGIIGSSVAFAAQSDVINAVSQIRQTDPNVPLSSNQKGNVGTILDNIFGTGVKQGIILSDYLDLAGTANYMPKYAGTGNGFVNSQVFDNGTNVGIGTTSPGAKLDVSGVIRSSSYGSFSQGITPALSGAPDAKIFSPSGDYIAGNTWGINYNEGSPDYIEFNNSNSVTSRIALDDGSAHFALGGGNVGIGTSSPTTRLHVGNGGDGAANGIAIQSNYPTIYFRDTDNRSAMVHVNSNIFYVLRGCGTYSGSWCTTSNGYWPLTINLENNDATFGGGVYAFNYFYNSDRRLKENIVPLDDALGKIRKLNGYTYDWKSSKKHDIGVIAQEVEQVYPQLVGESKDGSGTTIKTVEYGNLVAPLIEATKTVANTNDAQDKEIAELKAQIAELKQVVKHLESSKK